MAAHVLDAPQRLTKPFWVSLTLHLAFFGALGVQAWNEHHRINMGDPNGGKMGGLLVNPVDTIPIPNRGGPENPVANDTKSQVPTQPAPKEKPKPAAKVKAPPPDAIPLKSNKAVTKKLADTQPQQPNKFNDQKEYAKNQLYAPSGPRMSSPLYQVQGGGGVGLGNNSPFGEEFGTYANIIRDNIARLWQPLRTGGTSAVVVTFTIHRDGSVTDVNIATSSGNPALDRTAERAVLDAQLPRLPDRFPRAQADVQLRFELGN